jgi:two-component system, NarL family, invasion response regulator UvrY
MPIPLLRILLVDDDELVREVLGIRLAAHQHLKIVGSVASGEEAILAAERLGPDLIILDLGLPGLSGIDTLRALIKSHPQTGVIVLSADQSPEQLQLAFDAGASAYVLKHASGFDLIEAIQTVSTGRRRLVNHG